MFCVMKNKYLMLAALMLPCALFTACGDDDEPVTENVEQPVRPITQTYVDMPVDNDFKADASYIQKDWVGEYEGWDDVQKKNTTIRRRLTLQPNGHYVNIVAGKIIASGKDQFFKFESEGGTYTYNANTGLVTYRCEYDSVLNYRDQSYTRYTKKHYYSKEEATYTEKADFSALRDGKRVWITKDTYLQSLTEQVLDLAFSMSEFAGDNRNDQNR